MEMKLRRIVRGSGFENETRTTSVNSFDLLNRYFSGFIKFLTSFASKRYELDQRFEKAKARG